MGEWGQRDTKFRVKVPLLLLLGIFLIMGPSQPLVVMMAMAGMIYLTLSIGYDLGRLISQQHEAEEEKNNV
jgi:hypothetical protein